MQNQYILRGITENRNIYLSKYKCISITSMWLYGVHMYLYWLFMFLHDSILFNWCNGLLFSLFLFIVTSFPCLSLSIRVFLEEFKKLQKYFYLFRFFFKSISASAHCVIGSQWNNTTTISSNNNNKSFI